MYLSAFRRAERKEFAFLTELCNERIKFDAMLKKGMAWTY